MSQERSKGEVDAFDLDPLISLRRQNAKDFSVKSRQRATERKIPVYAENYQTVMVDLSPVHQSSVPCTNVLADYILQEGHEEYFTSIRLAFPQDASVTSCIDLVGEIHAGIASHVDTKKVFLQFSDTQKPHHNIRHTGMTERQQFGMQNLTPAEVTLAGNDLTVKLSVHNYGCDSYNGMYAVEGINTVCHGKEIGYVTLAFRKNGEPFHHIAAALLHFQAHAKLLGGSSAAVLSMTSLFRFTTSF